MTDMTVTCAQHYLDFETHQSHTWCSGCGNYGILNGIMLALAKEGLQPHQVAWANDVGCSGNGSDKIITYTIHGLHGRVLPLASGMSLATNDMPVICMAGDGATLSEGINHLIHTARNNYNITFILHNNNNYGLTTGQASSTTPKGCRMKGTPGETNAQTLYPGQLVLSAGGTFVARGYSGDVPQITELVRAGMAHKGFSFIEIMQLCPTFNKATPEEWYLKRIYDVTERDDFDTTNKWDAMKVVEDFDRLATGILYQDTTPQNDFYSLQAHREQYSTATVDEVASVDVTDLCKAFAV